MSHLMDQSKAMVPNQKDGGAMNDFLLLGGLVSWSHRHAAAVLSFVLVDVVIDGEALHRCYQTELNRVKYEE